MCPENQLLGGTGVSEASEGLSASSWSRTMGHSLYAWCRLLMGYECLYLPQTMGEGVYLLANFKLE